MYVSCYGSFKFYFYIESSFCYLSIYCKYFEIDLSKVLFM